MGCNIEKKWGIFLSIASVLIICAITGSIGYYYYHVSSSTNSTDAATEKVTVQVDGDAGDDNEDLMQGDDPNAREQNNTSTIESIGCDAEQGFKCEIRLDTNVAPTHYDLFLNPDIEIGTFDGTVSILLKIDKSVSHIRLHSKYLNITDTLLFHGADRIEIQEAFEEPENEYWVVIPAEPEIPPGQYNLTMTFNGLLTQGLTGLYRSRYVDAHNVTRYIVTTKFQPTAARKAFPCFDEPGFKSTFTVTLVKPNNAIALGNMPVDKEIAQTPTPESTTVIFRKSEKMVTYLVVIAIGDFVSINTTTTRGLPIRIFTTRSNINKAAYAAEITPKMVDFYEEYFEIPFPLPKLDIIGIPDFISGAMEHWGLISFRESNLLYKPGVAAAINKQRIATVIAHELVHNWFGNLVTMKWWNDLYLNEGFASFMEYKGVDAVHPEWEMERQFASNDLALVLQLDGQQSSHPIVQDVKNPDQITEIFDTISYNKGSSVLRMLESFMTPSKFREGIINFLNKFAFKNAVTKDLWDFLQEQMSSDSNIDISQIMNTWTMQMAYPVVSVELEDNKVVLSQERFIEGTEKNQSLLVDDKPSPFGYSWDIPMQISTPKDYGNSTLYWITQREKSIEIPIEQPTSWIKVNGGQFGYFRVNFQESMWKELKNVYHRDFSPEERCGLIDDALALANAQYLNYDVAFDFMLAFVNETHYVPWDCLDSHLRKIGRLLQNSLPDSYALFKELITKLTLPLYRTLTWTDKGTDSHLQRLLKNIIFGLSCESGNPSCLQETKALFDDYVRHPRNNSIPSDLRGIVYKWGMWQSNETVWNTVWKLYTVETDAQEKVRLLQCLSSSRENGIIQRLLERAKQDRFVRRQDFFTLIKFIAKNPIGNELVWKFYRNEYKELVKRFSLNDRYFGRMVIDIVSDYASQVQLDEMNNFFKTYPEAGAGRRARQTAIEKVQNNIAWTTKNSKYLEIWLKSYFA